MTQTNVPYIKLQTFHGTMSAYHNYSRHGDFSVDRFIDIVEEGHGMVAEQSMAGRHSTFSLHLNGHSLTESELIRHERGHTLVDELIEFIAAAIETEQPEIDASMFPEFMDVELQFFGERPDGFGDTVGYGIASHGGVHGALEQLQTDVKRLRGSGYSLTFVARVNGVELHEIEIDSSTDRQMTIDMFIESAAAMGADAA